MVDQGPCGVSGVVTQGRTSSPVFTQIITVRLTRVPTNVNVARNATGPNQPPFRAVLDGHVVSNRPVHSASDDADNTPRIEGGRPGNRGVPGTIRRWRHLSPLLVHVVSLSPSFTCGLVSAVATATTGQGNPSPISGDRGGYASASARIDARPKYKIRRFSQQGHVYLIG